MPAKLPNLLINGSSGIAVGMATNMAPHNLTEVVNGIVAYLENPDITVDELMEHVTAPDFPTGGIIYGVSGVREGYRTGRGRVLMRAKTHLEDMDRGNRQAIIVDEIPYQVNKAVLQQRIAIPLYSLSFPKKFSIRWCLIPRFDGAILSWEWKDVLWDKFVTEAPRPRTPSELQYNDRTLRSRR